MGKAPRLIFANRFYWPDHSATSQLLTDLAEYLVSVGWRVTVLTSRQLYQNAAADLPVKELQNGVEIKRLGGTWFGRGSLWGRAIDYLGFLVGATTWLLRHSKSEDVIVAKTDPPFLGLASLIGARPRGARSVVWHQDLFPDVAYASGLKLPKLARPWLEALRNCIVRRADENVAIGVLMAERIAAIAPGRRPALIHNWAPFGVIHPLPRESSALRKEWGLDGKFVVGYSGNMGRAHEFETILAAADLVRDDPSIAFLLIGDGAKRDEVVGRAKTLGLDNISLRPYQPLERLAESLSVPDVHLVTLYPPLEGMIVPSKFYGILAAGRPVLFIGDVNGEIARLCSEYQCGRAIVTGDAPQLAGFVKELASRPDTRATMAANALNASRGNLGRTHSLCEWAALLKRVSVCRDTLPS